MSSFVMHRIKLLMYKVTDDTNFTLRLHCSILQHCCFCVESGGWLQSAETVDYDRWPSPVAASDQEHGFPEVLQHGTVTFHTLRSSWCANCWPWCSRSCKAEVSDVYGDLNNKMRSIIDWVLAEISPQSRLHMYFPLQVMPAFIENLCSSSMMSKT